MTDQDQKQAASGEATPGKHREPSYKRHGARYRARRRAVDLIFEAEQRGVDAVKMLEERLEMARDPELGVNPIPEYTEQIVRGVAAEIVGIDSTISSYLSEEWPLRRIPAVDRAILRLSTWELFHNSDVPPRVAVVEGVELASEYSTDVAPPYINAVLDAEASVADQARLAAAAVALTPIVSDPLAEGSAPATDFEKAAADQAAYDASNPAPQSDDEYQQVPDSDGTAAVTGLSMEDIAKLVAADLEGERPESRE
nr:transcription antitermination factor NusB [Corynebacterium lactis]